MSKEHPKLATLRAKARDGRQYPVELEIEEVETLLDIIAVQREALELLGKAVIAPAGDVVAMKGAWKAMELEKKAHQLAEGLSDD